MTAPDPRDASSQVSETPIEFKPRLQGATLFLDVIGRKQLFAQSCTGELTLQKRQGDAWVALRDERPVAENPGYYLDDKYVWPSFNLGCDQVVCGALSIENGLYVGVADEYAKTGVRTPPPDPQQPADQPGPDRIDVIETWPVSGDVLISLRYFEDAACSHAGDARIEFSVPAPEQGMCCPIGFGGCSSEGPGGGWAPSLAACKPWSLDYDAKTVRKTDSRGCAALVPDYDMCCGCPDVDAGI